MDVKQYLPEVLTGIGIGGIFGTAAFAIEGTIKSVREYDEEKERLGRDLTIKETIKLCWKNYIHAGITAVSSAICIVASDVTHTKRYAAVATAWAMSDSALKDLTAKIPEIVGEEKAEEIHNAVAQDKINKTVIPTDILEKIDAPAETVEQPPLDYNSEVVLVDDQRVLCYDLRYGRYFMASRRDIMDAENEINKLILAEGYASLNDFYALLHLTPTTGGDDLGWNSTRDGYLDIRFGSMLAPGGRPCLTIEYFIGPREDYSDYS